LEERHSCAYFTNETNLALRVISSVHSWEKDNILVEASSPVSHQLVNRGTVTSASWGIEAVGALNSPYTGKGITIGTLCTGVDTKHPAFKNTKFVIKNFTDCGNDDKNGHGTHCAGTVFGGEYNGQRIGIAPEISRVLVAKVLSDNGAGTTDSIVEGASWAIENGAQILSCNVGIDFAAYAESLMDQGIPTNYAVSRALEAYLNHFKLFQSLSVRYASRCLFVCSAGNESSRNEDKLNVQSSLLPAALEGFLSVGAVSKVTERLEEFKLASFSNSGVDIVAPGVEIQSVQPGGELVTLSGTSMAADHAVGIAALWAERQIKIRGQFDVKDLIASVRASASFDLLQKDIDPLDVGSGFIQAPIS